MPYSTRNHTCQDSTCHHFYKNPQYLILYTPIEIAHDSIFAFNYYIHFPSFHMYTYTIHAELKIFFHLPQTLK